jgi:PAS domain S-box-containing protein
MDLTSNLVYLSDELINIYGIERKDNSIISIRKFMSQVHPDDRELVEEKLLLLHDIATGSFEHRIIDPRTGEFVYLIHHVQAVRDKNGTVIEIFGTTKDITEFKRTRIKLQESERDFKNQALKLTEILESLGDGFFTIDQNSRITYLNKKAEELLGLKRDEALCKSIWELFPEALDKKFFTEYHKAINEHTNIHFEEYLPSVDKFFEVSAYPSKGSLTVYFKNINDKIRKEQELKLSNERLEFVSNATRDAIWDWDIVNDTCFYNEAFTQYYHFTIEDQCVPGSWYNYIHPEDRNKVKVNVEQAINNKEVSLLNDSYRVMLSNGQVNYVHVRAIIIRNENGIAIRMVGSIQNITNQKEAEIILEKREKRFRAMVQSGQDMIALMDASFKIHYLSPNYEKITGYTFRYLLDIEDQDVIHSEDLARLRSEASKVLTQGTVTLSPYRFKAKDNSYRWFETTITNFLDDEDINAIVCNTRDITSRRNAEEAIRISEERYKLLFYKNPSPKWVFNASNYHIIEVNDAACALYGYSKEELLGMTIQDLKMEEEKHLVGKTINENLSNGNLAYSTIVKHKKKNGEVINVELDILAIELPTGLHFIVSGYDLTERIALQNKIVEEKVTAQKKIARTIIQTQEKERSDISKELHDNINQILTSAKLCIENTKYFPEHRDVFTEKSIMTIQNAIQEVRTLSKALVSPTINENGLHASISELLNQYRDLKRFHIIEEQNFDDQLLDKELKITIYRILQELLNNIVKYAGATEVTISIVQNKDKSIVMQVQDNGKGFDTCVKRSGLGLTNIKNRVELFKGRLDIQTTKGKGCKTIIVFP